jgi:hypothetical protein
MIVMLGVDAATPWWLVDVALVLRLTPQVPVVDQCHGSFAKFFKPKREALR